MARRPAPVLPRLGSRVDCLGGHDPASTVGCGPGSGSIACSSSPISLATDSLLPASQRTFFTSNPISSTIRAGESSHRRRAGPSCSSVGSVPEKGIAELLDAWAAAAPEDLELARRGRRPVASEARVAEGPERPFCGSIAGARGAAADAHLPRAGVSFHLVRRSTHGPARGAGGRVAFGCLRYWWAYQRRLQVRRAILVATW